MKRLTLILLVVLFSALTIGGQEQPVQVEQTSLKTEVILQLGKIYFPRDFLHKKTPYKKGNYFVELIKKENDYYFLISNAKKELLFEELAVIKPNNSKRKFKQEIRKEILRGEEFFRISVIKPDQKIMAYFLIKK